MSEARGSDDEKKKARVAHSRGSGGIIGSRTGPGLEPEAEWGLTGTGQGKMPRWRSGGGGAWGGRAPLVASVAQDHRLLVGGSAAVLASRGRGILLELLRHLLEALRRFGKKRNSGAGSKVNQRTGEVMHAGAKKKRGGSERCARAAIVDNVPSDDIPRRRAREGSRRSPRRARRASPWERKNDDTSPWSAKKEKARIARGIAGAPSRA